MILGHLNTGMDEDMQITWFEITFGISSRDLGDFQMLGLKSSTARLLLILACPLLELAMHLL